MGHVVSLVFPKSVILAHEKQTLDEIHELLPRVFQCVKSQVDGLDEHEDQERLDLGMLQMLHSLQPGAGYRELDEW